MLELTPNPSWLLGAEYDLVGRRHRLDRRRVPSVTQSLDLAYPNRFAGVPPDVLERKAQIGTAVHAAAHYDAEQDLVEASLVKEVQQPFAAWRWFRESRQVEPILCESVVCSRDLALAPRRRRPFIGKLDFLCRVDRRLIVLLDLKTGIPALARMQTLGYLDALYQQYPQLMAIDVQRWAVQLTAEGRYVVHVFRDDAIDAHDFRDVLERAYVAPHVDWSLPMADTHRPTELPIELPEEDPLPSMFDLPDDESDLIGPDLRGPAFELPDEAPPPAAAIAGEVLPADAGPPAIRELLISPDLETYLSTLERAIAPYEATAQAFAAQMKDLPIDTPQQLAALGQQSLVAKDREKVLDELFEPAIRGPRVYLDRVYAVKRRVVQFVKSGGETAARRYTTRKRELEEADRKARLEADRRQREAQQAAEAQAAIERRRLAQEAALAAQQGNPAAAADLIEQARAVEPEPVAVELPPPALAEAAAVPGLGTRQGWEGAIVEMKDAILAAARPDIFREVAQLIEGGDLTAGGGQSPTTIMIANRLKALALELPIIPSTMFAGDPDALKTRAAADHDTLKWPGFRFYRTETPVRRTKAATK